MSSQKRSLILLFTFLAMTAGLSSCSLRKLIVSNLDWFLMREMNSYFDLTDEQYETFSGKGKEHLNWFGKTQIPWLIEEIQFIQSQKKPLDPQYMENLANKKMRQLWFDIADRLSPDGAILFGQLTEKQYSHLKEELEEDISELTELVDVKASDFQEEYKDLQEDMIDKTKQWVGPLTDEQRKKIMELTTTTREDFVEEVKILIEIKHEFLRQVKIKAKEGEVESFLKKWARQPNIEGERYKNYRDWQFKKQLKIWIEMEKLITEEQREYRRKELDDVIGDLKTIANTKF